MSRESERKAASASVCVLGAGVSGLTSAFVLQLHGYDVCLALLPIWTRSHFLALCFRSSQVHLVSNYNSAMYHSGIICPENTQPDPLFTSDRAGAHWFSFALTTQVREQCMLRAGSPSVSLFLIRPLIRLGFTHLLFSHVSG
jgi:hypothetical protein